MRYAMILLVACGAGPREPTPPAPPPPPPDAPFAIRPDGPVALPVAYTRCTADADCTFVALGCCDTTAVLRERAVEAQRMLEASGRPYCAVKAACGPGPDGTWVNTPGRCVNAQCVHD